MPFGSRVFVANDFAKPYGAFPLGVGWAPLLENPVRYDLGYLFWSQESFIPAVYRVTGEVEFGAASGMQLLRWELLPLHGGFRLR